MILVNEIPIRALRKVAADSCCAEDFFINLAVLTNFCILPKIIFWGLLMMCSFVPKDIYYISRLT